MMIELDPKTQARIEALNVAFRNRLGETLAQLDAAVGAVAGAATDAEREDAVRAVAALAHMLSGTAATFGMAAVGDAARELEQAADRVITQGAEGADETIADELEALARDVRAGADEDTH